MQQGSPIVPNLSPGAKSVKKYGKKYPMGQNYKIVKIGKGRVLGGRIYEMLNIFTNMTSEGLEIHISLIQMDINPLHLSSAF